MYFEQTKGKIKDLKIEENKGEEGPFTPVGASWSFSWRTLIASELQQLVLHPWPLWVGYHLDSPLFFSRVCRDVVNTVGSITHFKQTPFVSSRSWFLAHATRGVYQ